MNKKHQYFLCLLLAGFAVANLLSCKKSFLEITPKGRIIASKTTDYDLLLNNLDLINLTNTGGYMDSQILLGDEVVAAEPQWSNSTFRETQLFKYEPNIYRVEEEAREIVPIKSLYICNKVINEVMESTGGAEVTKKNLQAEAMVGRAWSNFMLVNYFGKPYQAATAATDLAFPLITEADINAKDHVRATVQEMYNAIISDLQTAIPILSNDGVVFRTRASKVAAQGLLAKVYIFMGRFSDALPLLNEAISNLSKSGITAGLVNYNTAFPGFPTTVNDLENAYSKNLITAYISTNRLLWLTPETAALFKPSDVRLQRWYITTTYPNGLVLYKRNGTTTINIGVRIPELYLLRAETKTRLEDLTGGAADVLLLRQNRMPNADAAIPSTVTSGKMPLLQFILDERIREFAITGYRWFDMRRLSVDPLFTTPTYQHKLYNASGVVSSTFTLKPERFVFKFPPKVLADNPRIIDNP